MFSIYRLYQFRGNPPRISPFHPADLKVTQISALPKRFTADQRNTSHGAGGVVGGAGGVEYSRYASDSSVSLGGMISRRSSIGSSAVTSTVVTVSQAGMGGGAGVGASVQVQGSSMLVSQTETNPQQTRGQRLYFQTMATL